MSTQACVPLMLAMVACGATAAPLTQSFGVSVRSVPVETPVEGHCLLRHELHLTNFDSAPHGLHGVTLLRDGAPLLDLRGEALTGSSLVLGAAASKHDAGHVLAPGARAVVFIDRDGACGNRAHSMLSHRIVFDADATIDTPGLQAGSLTTPSLGAPLRGGPWAAVASPAWPRGHRRVFYALDGVARLPGRYAIDFVRVDDDGRITRGDADRAADALGYGADVLAVADARVAAVRNDIGETESIAANGKHPLERAAGNHVALQLADGRFAVYEHLRPGSVTVRVGDRVTQGQVIGQLGFSGDSTGPHLHFHVGDRAEPLLGEGLPYTFAQFDLLGRYDDLADLGTRRWQSRELSLEATRRDEFPGSNRVLRFPD